MADGNSKELYLVFGGEVIDTRSKDYKDPDNLDIRGIFPTYDAAVNEWRTVSQKNVDNAFMKYVVVQLW